MIVTPVAAPPAPGGCEYLDLMHPGPVRLVPADARQALDVRLLGRIFDNYVMMPVQKIVGDSLREAVAAEWC